MFNSKWIHFCISAISARHFKSFSDNKQTKQIINKKRYMIFFQLPVVPEKLLTAFGASLFRWVFQRPGLKPQDAKAYLDLYQSPSKSFFFLLYNRKRQYYSLWSSRSSSPLFRALRCCQTESGLMAFLLIGPAQCRAPECIWKIPNISD